MWVPKLLLSPVKIRIFAQKQLNLARNWHFWSFCARPCRLILCPVGGLVGGCGARAVYRKTPIYFMYYILHPSLFPPDWPEFDHCLPSSQTHSVITRYCWVLADVTLAFEDANSKLVDVVSVVDIDSEEHVDDGSVKILKLRYWSFWSKIFGQNVQVEVLKL